MTKTEKDNYWMDCIQKCRTSGLSDYEWCRQNGISTSSFYYNVRRLRMKACSAPAASQKETEKQEVVPVLYNELPEIEAAAPENDTIHTVRIDYNGMSLFISNDAQEDVIAAVLKAARQLC